VTTKEPNPSYLESLTPESIKLGASGDVMGQRELQRGVTQAQADVAPKDFFTKLGQERKTQSALAESQAMKSDLRKINDMQNNNFDNSLKYERQLSRINSEVANTLVNEQKRVQLDSMGRKMLSERQLQDWYSTKVKTDEEWRSFELRSNQLHERRLQVLKRSHDLMLEAERSLYETFAAGLDRETKATLAEKKRELEAKIQQAENDAANSSALASGLGTVLGAVGTIAGGVLGAKTVVGAPAGAAAGGAGGTLIGTKLGSEIAKSQSRKR
jgi:hypothetical protein